eukprot:6030820-Amphidinium_carterae.1
MQWKRGSGSVTLTPFGVVEQDASGGFSAKASMKYRDPFLVNVQRLKRPLLHDSSRIDSKTAGTTVRGSRRLVRSCKMQLITEANSSMEVRHARWRDIQAYLRDTHVWEQPIVVTAVWTLTCSRCQQRASPPSSTKSDSGGPHSVSIACIVLKSVSVHMTSGLRSLLLTTANWPLTIIARPDHGGGKFGSFGREKSIMRSSTFGPDEVYYFVAKVLMKWSGIESDLDIHVK